MTRGPSPRGAAPTRRQVLAGSAAFAALPRPRRREPELARRPLGRTGRELPVLGLGCFPIGGLDDEDTALAVVRRAHELGVRYFDTAPSYARGESERRVGRALADVPREELFVNTKTLERDGDAALAEVEASLERLGLDHLDAVQVHAVSDVADAESLVGPGAVAPALAQARKDGKIRHVGITGHRDPAAIARALELFDFETALVPINPLDCLHRSFTRELLPLARKQAVGVIAMKVYAGGPLARAAAVPPGDLIRFALSRPGVTLAVPGADSVERVEAAHRGALAEAPTPTEAETWIEAVGPHRGPDSEWYKAP